MSLKPTNPKDGLGSTKLALHLVPSTTLYYLASAHHLGAAKYGSFNWRVAGARASVYASALQRHFMAWWEGEEIDADGTHHLANALACLSILVDAKHCGQLVDDRPPSNARTLAELRVQLEEVMARIANRQAGEPQPVHYTQAQLEWKLEPEPPSAENPFGQPRMLRWPGGEAPYPGWVEVELQCGERQIGPASIFNWSWTDGAYEARRIVAWRPAGPVEHNKEVSKESY